MIPTNSISVRSRFRHSSPTISTQQQQQQKNSTAKDSNDRIPSRLARSSFQSRYHTANRWSGPPSPTKGPSSSNNNQGQKQQTTTATTDRSNTTQKNTNSSNNRALSATAHEVGRSKLRARAASRGRASDPPPTASSPATKGTATTAPSTTASSSPHLNSISLTRRRLSQPIVNTPLKTPSKFDASYPTHQPTTHHHQPTTTTANGTTNHRNNGGQKSNNRSGNNNNSNTATENEELVCDYDTSATGLYELLESSQWDQARSRCRSHPAEVRTWIVRRDKAHKIRWKLLPLHAAIIFQSPNEVVSALLDKYPQAASCPDDQGMLPLHLAFRHKQEDEDLLELLLVQYPKAVLMKDKRQRVPLEHGRESKFSAKLVWLYADATVIGTGNNNSNKDEDQGTAQTSINTSLRADMERELRREHEEEMDRIRREYENKLQTLEEKNAYETQHIKVVVDDERQTLVERHAEEMAELKEMLSQQAEREANLTGDYQVQIDELQHALETSARQNDGLTLKYGKMEEFNRELRNQLQTIIRDQLFIRDLATRQNNELDAARKMRAQIIQTLMQQEDTDGENDRSRSNKLIEMAENVRDRIHDILRNDPSENFDEEGEMLDGGVTPAGTGVNAGDGLGPSRIEVERGGHDGGGGGFIEEHHQKGHHGGGFFEERDDVFLAKIPEVELRDVDDALGDLKSLGDEISGITEHSPY